MPKNGLRTPGNPLSFSPQTGLMYIPQDSWMVVSRVPDGQFQFRLGRTTIGAGTGNFPSCAASSARR